MTTHTLDRSAATATVYRMVMPEHLCPFGLKTVDLLRRKGFQVEDHPLCSREQTDAFKREQGVKTTPQVFIDGQRIGGYDDLRRHLGLAVRDPEATRYTPVLVVFACALLAAFALQWGHNALGAGAGAGAGAGPGEGMAVPWSTRLATGVAQFAALSTLVLAILKLQDLEGFTNRFLGYDLLAQRVVRYAYAYPFAEAFVALSMLAAWHHPLPALLALTVGTIGAASVFKAVYLEHRELTCACVGGGSRVPLGAVSLTENLVMVAMGLWMLWR